MMKQEYFVDKDSVVRRIWGNSDTILFIFAGAAAEFALNKAVDWLYFTGKLPVDPLGRLFSTVSYARAIVFSEKQGAFRAIDSMVKIHGNVEAKRGVKIPDWAYRDVLFLLIDYSIRTFELFERTMTRAEKNEVFQVFHRIGSRMGMNGLPDTFQKFENMRYDHLYQNLARSNYTDDLFKQYRKHLGPIRYWILIEAQKMVVPNHVRDLLKVKKASLMHPIVALYKASRLIKLDWLLKELVLPREYKSQIRALDVS